MIGYKCLQPLYSCTLGHSGITSKSLTLSNFTLFYNYELDGRFILHRFKKGKRIVQLVYSEFILLEMDLTKSTKAQKHKIPCPPPSGKGREFCHAILPLPSQLVLCYTMSREVWGIVQSRSLSFFLLYPYLLNKCR